MGNNPAVSAKRSTIFAELDEMIKMYPDLIKGRYTNHEYREHTYDFYQVGNRKVNVSADSLYLNPDDEEVVYVENFLENLLIQKQQK